MADKLKDDGKTTVIVIGITSLVDMIELNNIASTSAVTEQYVLLVEHFYSLNAIEKMLEDFICKGQ